MQICVLVLQNKVRYEIIEATYREITYRSDWLRDYSKVDEHSHRSEEGRVAKLTGSCLRTAIASRSYRST